MISAKDISIENECFKNCSSLKNIEFKNANKIRLGSSAFYECVNIDDLIFSSLSIIDIDENCFTNSKNIQQIVLNAKNIFIKSESFKNCSSLKSVKLVSLKYKNKQNDEIEEDNEMTSSSYLLIQNITIGDKAFSELNELEEVSIYAENEVFMNDYCFYMNPKLKSVSIFVPELHFGDYCFSKCEKLVDISIPYFSIPSFEQNTFKRTKATLKLIANEEEIYESSNSFYEIIDS
ncbi:hypothetical protein M9Y10_019877 [Tritrichomonas musculus]|uniref:Surface antigen BspA-like n=1 Tax=Tritrichomonas musculus TaxID=1915356 RepID=A0ABR2HHI0_9EUKA